MEYANIILRIAEILAIIIVGLIFKSQIKSQGDLINNMTQYSNLIDIKKLKDYTETMIELSKTEAKLDAIKYVKEELATGRYNDSLSGPNKTQSNEFMAFSIYTYINASPELRKYLSSIFFNENREALDYVASKFDKPS